MPLSLTQFTFQNSTFILRCRRYRLRDASENPLACLLQKIEATARRRLYFAPANPKNKIT